MTLRYLMALPFDMKEDQSCNIHYLRQFNEQDVSSMCIVRVACMMIQA